MLNPRYLTSPADPLDAHDCAAGRGPACPLSPEYTAAPRGGDLASCPRPAPSELEFPRETLLCAYPPSSSSSTCSGSAGSWSPGPGSTLPRWLVPSATCTPSTSSTGETCLWLGARPSLLPNGQGWCGSLHRGEILMNLVLFLRRSRVGASSFPGSSACPPWALP